ncbi:MAG: hypothetical protein KKF22_10040, partial [Gammaproteobacteria bacterium]|nr:hypothetical protein [Gammaproteobacteria bacterium]
DYQEDVAKDYQEDVAKDYQEDVAKDYQEDVAKDHQEDAAKDHQEDVAKDHQEDVTKDYQEDVTKDYQEDVTKDYQEDVTKKQLENNKTHDHFNLDLIDRGIKQLIFSFSGVLSRMEIQVLLDLKDAEYVRQRYLIPALKQGFIEMTIPDRPSSKFQKYRLTKLGKTLKSEL